MKSRPKGKGKWFCDDTKYIIVVLLIYERDVIYERVHIWICSYLLTMRSREGLAPRDRGTWTLTIRRTTADWMWTVEAAAAAEADSRPARGCLTRLANVVAIGAVTNVTRTTIMMLKLLWKTNTNFDLVKRSHLPSISFVCSYETASCNRFEFY